MRGFGIPAAARASMVVGLAIAGLASTSQAAAKHQNPPPGKLPFLYNTTGLVNVQGAPNSVNGPALLQYQGVTGATFTPAKEVCRLPCALKGEGRTRRWEPASTFR